MSVAPRWKRRADEIAEAIGDELSVNGTVSIGNDVSLSVATITALADAIALVLNPSSIAAAIWLQQEVATHVATVLAANSSGLVEFRIDTLNGVFVIQRSHIYNYDISAQVYAGDYATGTVVNIILASGTTNQYRLLNPAVLDHNVSVLSTNTTPVHVQVRNIAGGFTAMGSDISASMKLSAQPVSVADTVNVKTATGEAVAIAGTVNLNVGSSTVPISNPNNITVPVVNTNSVTVPVSLGSVTLPVKATAAGIPQNANGISLYLPVDSNHGLTIPVSGGTTSVPVANTNNVTVSVSGGTTSIPISGGTTSVPVANTNNVTVPISGGTSSVPVANTNSVVVPVRTVTGTTNAADGTGAAVVVPAIASGAQKRGSVAQSHNVAASTYGALGGWNIVLDDGTLATAQFLFDPKHNVWLNDTDHAAHIGMRVVKNVITGFNPNGWHLERGEPSDIPLAMIASNGTILHAKSTFRSDGHRFFKIQKLDGTTIDDQIMFDPVRNNWLGTASGQDINTHGYTEQMYGGAIVKLYGNTNGMHNNHWQIVDMPLRPLTALSSAAGAAGGGVRGTVTEATNQGGADPWWKVTLFGETVPEPTIYGNMPSSIFVGLNIVKTTGGTWVPLYQYD